MEYKLEKETALVEAILFLESEPLSEEAISIIGQLSKDVVDIALENLKERYDASINSQLDVIIRNVYDNSQNGKLDLEQYLEDETE